MIRFLSHFGAAEFAPVFISVSIRQYQQKEFVDRYGAGTIRTVQFRCLEFIERIPRLLWPGDFSCEKRKGASFIDKTLDLG